jgi:DNA-binding transcriptional ArsR family regulator
MVSPVVNKQNQVTAIFAALADPTRRRVMVRLSERGETPVTVLAKPFRISPPGFSKHLGVLEKAQLIQRHRKGRLHLIRARAAVWTRLRNGWPSARHSGIPGLTS